MAKVLDSAPEQLGNYLDEPRKMLINGEWISTDETFETINPATGKVITLSLIHI